jgi:hypothetical protein
MIWFFIMNGNKIQVKKSNNNHYFVDLLPDSKYIMKHIINELVEKKADIWLNLVNSRVHNSKVFTNNN